MKFVSLVSVAFLGAGSVSLAKSPTLVPSPLDSQEEADASVDSNLPSFDLLRVRYESHETLNFSDGPGELDSARYTLTSFLHKPIKMGQNWRLFSLLSYRATTLDFSELGAGSLLKDETLHKASLHGMFFHRAAGSRWLYGAWGRVSYSGDGGEVNGDDFFYDVALTAAYEVNRKFTFGLAVTGIEIGGDAFYVGGPMVLWKPSDDVSLSIIGPLLISKWEISDRWTLAIRGAPYGSTWNIDDDGQSIYYDLSSYAFRLHSEHRLTDKLWLSLGVGYTIAGDFEVRDSSDNRLLEEDLDGGLAFSVGFRLRAW